MPTNTFRMRTVPSISKMKWKWISAIFRWVGLHQIHRLLLYYPSARRGESYQCEDMKVLINKQLRKMQNKRCTETYSSKVKIYCIVHFTRYSTLYLLVVQCCLPEWCWPCGSTWGADRNAASSSTAPPPGKPCPPFLNKMNVEVKGRLCIE